MGPVLCMISDGTSAAAGGDDRLVARVAAAAAAGVHLVQIRERDRDARSLMHLVERCVDAVRATGARIVVNERADVALAAGAHGVHLRADSLAASRVRAIVPRGFLIGRSVHDEDVDRADWDGVDYLIYGTVFESPSKPGRAAAGLDALERIAARATVPVLAVGGVTIERMSVLGGSGAAGWAAIGLFADCPLGDLQVTLRKAALSFDTPGRVP